MRDLGMRNQRDLAARAGCDQALICRTLKGDDNLTDDIAGRIASALLLDVESVRVLFAQPRRRAAA
jgi:hypothetical protein